MRASHGDLRPRHRRVPATLWVAISFIVVEHAAFAQTAIDVEVGATGGRDNGGRYLGSSVSGDYHLDIGSGAWWLHGLALGAYNERSDGGPSPEHLRFGIGGGLGRWECFRDGALCVVLEGDAAFRHVGRRLPGNPSSDNDGVVIGRVALDLGGAHLRFRSALEITSADGVAATIAAAYELGARVVRPPAVRPEDLGPEPTSYIQADVLELLFVGFFGVEAGHHLYGPVWGHAEIAYGYAASPGGGSSGTTNQQSAGLEALWCTPHRLMCTIVGVDLGRDHSETNHSGETPPFVQHTYFVAIPRAVVEIGGNALRFRIGIEGYYAFAIRDWPGGKPVMGLAYQW